MMKLHKGIWGLIVVITLFLVGCAQAPVQEVDHDEILALPDLEAVELDDGALKVVATTSIIGDVVGQVGGDDIELTTLMEPGQDPHSYEPGARELTAVASADVIFISGWDLEEGLVTDLAEIGNDVPLISISANIEPLTFGDHEHKHDDHEHEEADEVADEHEHNGIDPHVWFNIANVAQWSENAVTVLSALDPANAETYADNAAAYQLELDNLAQYVEPQLATIPASNRFMVTNHDTFSYFAAAYDFELIGTVIPAASTLAEPSANDLTALISEMEAHAVCTIFTETTISDSLAQTITAELDDCDEVQVLELYTGAIGPAGSGADSYIGMFRANVDTIVAGLQ